MKFKPFNKVKNKLFKSSTRDFLLNQMPKNSICAEIGTHLGEFSEQILTMTNPRCLHLIDPWEYENDSKYENSWYGKKKGVDQQIMNQRYYEVIKKFEDEIKSGQVIVHRIRSSVLKEFDNDYFDWIYIDGNHLYEYVKNDLNLSLQKVKTNGYITGDDYLVKGWWDDGVTKAVNEFVTNKPVQLIKIKNNQFIMKKIGHDKISS